ncbi:hypothetical protein [Micromonospora avicenniae]|uniref:hypothetical protein n=1 Tax=Micromonospora avicenniae TaxID=1198245 RepID=UPI00158A25E2|nr:hypothetical protein [Micromonospora avicenniae]
MWRADHAASGVPTGWTLNTADTGLTVNGDDVTVASHQGWGMGSYCYCNVNAAVVAA